MTTEQATKIVLACSGGSDVGSITDLAARRLAREGVAKMACLTGIAGGVPSKLKELAAARGVLAIDGCPNACATRVLNRAGFRGFCQLRLDELGLAKGSCPATDAVVGQVADKACVAFVGPASGEEPVLQAM